MPTPVSIYGYKPPTPCIDKIELNAIRELENLIGLLSTTLDDIYPNIDISIPQLRVAPVTVAPSVSSPQFVRLKWVSLNAGTLFTASLAQCNELVEIYSSIGVTDWQANDPKLVGFFAANGVTV